MRPHRQICFRGQKMDGLDDNKAVIKHLQVIVRPMTYRRLLHLRMNINIRSCRLTHTSLAPPIASSASLNKSHERLTSDPGGGV